MSPRDTEPRLFFIHLMRSAGTTFAGQLQGTLSPDEIYPGPGDPSDGCADLEHLASLRPDRRARIRAYTGHFPYFASEIARARNREVSTGPLITATLLRDPIQRVLSVLRQQQVATPERSLEEIYDDPATYAAVLRDHEPKVFSLRVGDPGPSVLSDLVVDGERLRAACRNLEQVDVIGRTDDLPRFADEVGAKLGWDLPAPGRARANPARVPPPRHLVERIRRDSEVGLAFHDFALGLMARRATLATRWSCQVNGFSRWRGKPVSAGRRRSSVPSGWDRADDEMIDVDDLIDVDERAIGVAALPAFAQDAAAPSS